MKTLLKQTSLFTMAESTFLPEGSPANPSALREINWAKQIYDTSFQKSLGQYEKLNPDGSFQKMFVGLLHKNLGQYSPLFVHQWRLKVITPCLYLFQLHRLTHRTRDTGFGLLPTPTAMMPADVDLEKLEARRRVVKERKKNGNGFGATLNELLKKGLLPTPKANDWRSGMANRYNTNHTQQLNDTIAYHVGKTSQLSPHYTLEMMGFPIDWLTKPYLVQDGGARA
jgi:hypothetical protein